jgi:hypothetical protein
LTQSRARKRAVRKARVAPRLEAKDTSTMPHSRPNTAPPASVMIAAPGKESAVTATYTAKKMAAASQGLAAR